GQETARVEVDLGDIVVERKFTAKGSTLTVKSKDGAKYSSSQALLDKMAGSLSFDPLDFCRATPKDQVATLIEITGLDLESITQERAALYVQRTAVGRRRDAAKAKVDGMVFDEDAPGEEVTVGDLVKRLSASKDLSAEKASVLACIDKQEADIARLQEDLESNLKALRRDQKMFLSMPDPEDEGDIEEEIENAEKVNAIVRANKAHRDVSDDLRADSRLYDETTAVIEAIDERKREALSSCELPVEGLSFDEDGIFYGGVPFSQASQAEQLRVSVAMGLAANPDLNTMLIHDGSLLDEANLAMLSDMAEEADAQLWVERVGHGPEVSVLIEDGEVRTENAAF
ncbi:MAG: hypothetical protein KAI64_01755, partial [Thermoplasmata archaeon]|nr:hypothetical protein [Thermoplasmata archaeon]